MPRPENTLHTTVRGEGDHRSARISGPQVLPLRRPTPIALWCVGPFPELPPWPLPSSPSGPKSL